MKRNLLKYCLITGLIALLSGCGFHLRTLTKPNPTITKLFINTQTPNAPFIQTLRNNLPAHGFELQNSQQTADAILTVSRAQETNRLTNLVGGGASGQYTVTLKVTFNVTTSQGRILLQPTTLSQKRTYSSNDTQVLSQNARTAPLISQMEASIARQIGNQIAVVNPSQNEN